MIKKIIASFLIAISVFTIVGCSQSKEELKEEVKQELKAEQSQIKEEEVKDITSESLAEFEKIYKEYNDNMSMAGRFMLTDDNPNKITVEQGIQIKKDADIIKEDMIQKSPSIITEELKKYCEIYSSLTDKLSKELKYTNEINLLAKNKVDIEVIIMSKLKELHTQLDK